MNYARNLQIIIEALRLRSGVSVAALAKTAGISPQTYRRVLVEDSRISTLQAIDRALFDHSAIGQIGECFKLAHEFDPRTIEAGVSDELGAQLWMARRIYLTTIDDDGSQGVF